MTTEAAGAAAPEPAAPHPAADQGAPALDTAAPGTTGPAAADLATADLATADLVTADPVAADPDTAVPPAAPPPVVAPAQGPSGWAVFPVPEPEAPPRKPRPRGRTALIMAGAVVLGVLGGGGTGYAVQAARRPTPLPPLSVAQPKYPARHVAGPALPASQDDQVKTDGDLTKLVVQPPKGSKDRITDWLDLADYAETRSGPGGAFSWYADAHFRRAAESLWDQGSTSYEIRLVQFAHDGEAGATSDVAQQQGYVDTVTGVKIPGTADGKVFPGSKRHGSGSYAYYDGYAFAQHGDISVQIRIDSDHPVTASMLVALAKNQLERL